MKVLHWTLTSLVLLGFASHLFAQPVPGLQPPAPPPALNGNGLPPMGNAPAQNPNPALPGDFQGAPLPGQGAYSGPAYGGGYEGGTFDGGSDATAGYDAECPPVFGNVWSTPGTFYFRADAFMLRRTGARQGIALIARNDATVLLSARDLSFRNETGQRFEAGYEFNECATLAVGFWEVQDWNPIRGIFSAANDLTLAGASGSQSANFTDAQSMEAQYRTMIKNYEVNWTNATIFDRLSLLGGFRYIDMIDRLAIISTRVAGPVNNNGTSDYIMRTTNRLLGGQIGAKAVYDIDLWQFEFIGKSGLYDDSVQFSKFYGDANNTVLVNPQAAPPVRHTLASVNEINVGFMRRLGNHFAVRAGYNVIWLTNIGLAADHFDESTNHVNNDVVRTGGDLFLYGAHVGADLRW